MKTTSFSRFASGHRSGFTIVELLVVITIIGLLVTLILPAMTNARAVARDLKCKVNLRSFADAIYMYQSTYKGYYPPSYDYWSGNTIYSTWSGTYLADFMNVQVSQWAFTPGGFMASTIKCPEDNESTANYPGYAVVSVGAGFSRAYASGGNWSGTGIVASDGNPGCFYANANGSAGTPRYASTNMDPASPYIVEFNGAGIWNDVAYANGGVNLPAAMRLRHGPNFVSASVLGTRMNYISTNLSVLTADFSSVAPALLTTNLGTSPSWYSVGSGNSYQTINGYSGTALLTGWPYGTGIATVRQGLLNQ